MRSTRSTGLMATALLTTLIVSAPLSAQVSDERIRELIKQVEAGAGRPAAPLFQPPGPATPEVSVPLTLDDAVRFALDRNLDIAVQRLNPQLQDISIASARAAFNPSLTSALSRASQVGVPSNQLQVTSGGAGVTSQQLAYNAGFSQSLPWNGATVSATFNNDRFVSDSNNSLFNPQFNANWSAVFTQPLMRGREIDTPRRNLAVSRINRDVSDDQLRATLTNTVSNVRNAYWDFVFATQAVEVARQSLDLATKLVEDNQIRVEVGTMAPIDVVQAQAEQATRRQGLVTAENARRTTELLLKRLIVAGTTDPNWTATLEPVDQPEFRDESIDLEDAIRRALDERTDLAIVRKSLQVNDLTMKQLRNQTLPDVDLQVTYGLRGIGGDFFQRSNAGILGSSVTTVIPGGISDTFGSLFSQNYPRWTVGLNMSYPIGLSSEEAGVARARVQLSQIEAQIKQIELQVATDVTNAAITLRNTAEAVQAAQAARELSQRRLEAEQSKFEVGMTTNYFVVQAQRDLNDARNSELRVILNYRKAQVEFERLQQTTLQSSSITMLQATGGGTAAFTFGGGTGTGGTGTGGTGTGGTGTGGGFGGGF